jgi:hypothetical protein
MGDEERENEKRRERNMIIEKSAVMKTVYATHEK